MQQCQQDMCLIQWWRGNHGGLFKIIVAFLIHGLSPCRFQYLQDANPTGVGPQRPHGLGQKYSAFWFVPESFCCIQEVLRGPSATDLIIRIIWYPQGYWNGSTMSTKAHCICRCVGLGPNFVMMFPKRFPPKWNNTGLSSKPVRMGSLLLYASHSLAQHFTHIQ